MGVHSWREILSAWRTAVVVILVALDELGWNWRRSAGFLEELQ